MGTNFYWYENPVKQEKDEGLHIGKSSHGWCFALRIYSENSSHIDGLGKVQALDDWKRLFNMRWSRIENEYGDVIEVEDMLQKIEDRCQSNGEPLLRHEIDGFCVGHGKGTYDLMMGYFS